MSDRNCVPRSVCSVWGAFVKGLTAFITDLLLLLQFTIIEVFSDYSQISVVFLYGLTCFLTLNFVWKKKGLYPLGYIECSGERTTFWESVTSALMNTKETYLPQEVNVWSLSVTLNILTALWSCDFWALINQMRYWWSNRLIYIPWVKRTIFPQSCSPWTPHLVLF